MAVRGLRRATGWPIIAAMQLLSMLGIAFGLSLDAFAVSVSNSALVRGLKLRHGLRMALSFGLFQMAMPVAGWAAGSAFSRYIADFDHWVAFGLLLLVGGRMVREGLRPAPADGCADGEAKDCRHLPTLLVLSVATSLDALAVGLSFAMIRVDIAVPVVVIGAVTFALCLAGYFLGSRIGRRLNLRLEIAGGLVLVAIGVKILLEHLLA